MMVDFFETACQEQELTHQQFGICDDEDGKKAYTNIDNVSRWIATVNNETEKKLNLQQLTIVLRY